MPITSELTRMAQNVGALNADTNAIFEALRSKGVLVPQDATLDDVVEMIGEIELNIPTSVEIGGRSYPVVQIGDQLWTTENLDWKLDGITIGASGNPTTPSAWYYNNDEATYGVNGNKYGLLYNWYSIDIITQALSNGWRVPTSDDFNSLGEYTGGLLNAGTKLKSTSGWEPLPNFPNPNGTDDYGFSGLPSGLRVNGSFNYATNYSFYLTTTESSDEVFYRAGLSVNTDLAIQPLNKNTGNSIRLVRTIS